MEEYPELTVRWCCLLFFSERDLSYRMSRKDWQGKNIKETEENASLIEQFLGGNQRMMISHFHLYVSFCVLTDFYCSTYYPKYFVCTAGFFPDYTLFEA